jgi:transcription elongation factor Elf1
MDEKQKADYLKNPYHCPYCNSDQIVALEFNGESLRQTVECQDCGREWTEVFTLTDVKPKSL